MTAARYSLIRFLADPARNEPINVGVIAWDASGVRLGLDDAALYRVYRLNPNLAKAAVDHVEELLESSIVARWGDAEGDPERLLSPFRKPPVLLTEPMLTNGDGSAANLEVVVDRLLRRLVRVVPRGNERGPKNQRVVTYFNDRFRRLIDEERIDTDVELPTGSGVTLAVNFWANSGANVALDVVNLSLSTPRKIQERVYSEAGKAFDLLGSGSTVRDLIIYCAPPTDDNLGATVAIAKAVIETTGATVTADREEAAIRFESLIGRR